MNALLAVLLVLVAVAGTATVLQRDPVRQSIVLGIMGLLLALLFFALQAPDVALSEITVGGIAIPVVLTLAIAKLRQLEAAHRDRHAGEAEG